MNKYLLVIFAVAALFVTSCKKSKNEPTPVPSSDSYLPVTSGTSWTYNDASGGVNSTTTITMTGATSVFNGKTYYNATSVSSKNGSSIGYFYAANHAYATRSGNTTAGIIVELQMGMDNQIAGYAWTTTPTDIGSINGVPAKTINTIKEKDISKVVNGKTFTNVIHTQVDLQYDLGSGFESVTTYDMYLAKGVGMIELVTTIYDTVIDTETITAYTVK